MINILTNFDQFTTWASEISFELKNSSKGQLRIGPNKLAAIMAATIPGTKASFNINTLKSELSKSAKEVFKEVNESSLLTITKIEILPFLENNIDEIIFLLKISGKETYEALNEDDTASLYFHDSYDISNEYLEIISSELPKVDQERINEAFNNHLKEDPNFLAMNFETLTSKTHGYAFREYIKDTLFVFLGEMDDFFDSKDMLTSFDDEELKQWLISSFKLWKDNNSDIPFEEACEEVKGPIKKQYSVHVRAVISASNDFLQEYEIPDVWDSYDYSTSDDGDGTVP